MFPRILSKLSQAALKLHVYLKRSARSVRHPDPYILKYEKKPETPLIIHFIENFGIGGSSQLVVDIIERGSERYRHEVVVPATPEPLPYQPVDISEFSIRQMTELRAFLVDRKPALVHVHYFVRDSFRFVEGGIWYDTVFRICADLGLRVIQNVNVPTHPHHSESVVHNVFVSNYVRDTFNDTDVENSVIYPGSNFDHFRAQNSHAELTHRIGMVYRLATDKLGPDAIEVFIGAVKKDARIKSYIVGDGGLLDHFKKRVKEERLTENFVFTGFVSYAELPSHYQQFDIFVAPVHDESFGQVTPFAMGMGKAVVGYDTGAISEIIGSKETLAETANVNGLVKIIMELIANQGEIQRLGVANRQRAIEMFSVEKMIRDYLALYDSQLQGRRVAVGELKIGHL